MSATGRVVVVTGAAGNLGRAVAAAFADNGDRLVLVDRDAQRLDAVFGNADPRRLAIAADLLESSGAAAAVALACDRYGRIDVLCNVAGGFRMGAAVHETDDAAWDQMLDLNARTVLHMARAVVPRMLEQGSGRIVNVAAHGALRGEAHMGAYTASKAVVVRLTEAMAGELGPRGIGVNCVLPGTLDTPENRAAMPDADPRQWVAPADLAQVIAFLASDAARAIHGAAIPVTGLA